MSSKKVNQLTRELDAVDRRIDNLRFLLPFQEKKRAQIIEAIRSELGRDRVRTKFIDFDARHDPSTDRFCIMCQKDLAVGAKAATVRLIHIGAVPHAVHVEDEAMLDQGILELPVDAQDMGLHLLGPDCAKRLGVEWNRTEGPNGGKSR